MLAASTLAFYAAAQASVGANDFEGKVRISMRIGFTGSGERGTFQIRGALTAKGTEYGLVKSLDPELDLVNTPKAKNGSIVLALNGTHDDRAQTSARFTWRIVCATGVYAGVHGTCHEHQTPADDHIRLFDGVVSR